jgi:hypothetical protein
METKKERIIQNKQKRFKQMTQPDIVRKKKLLREEELTPWDILEGVSMQNPTLLNIISDNNNIQNYTKLEKGVYSSRYNGYRVVLTLNKYNADKATCESLIIGKKDYHTGEYKEASVYLENNELKIEKR